MSAFGLSEGLEIVQLIGDLLADQSAQPLLSLVATANQRVVGHVLFRTPTGAGLALRHFLSIKSVPLGSGFFQCRNARPASIQF